MVNYGSTDNGVASRGSVNDDVGGNKIEKPVLAAVLIMVTVLNLSMNQKQILILRLH